MNRICHCLFFFCFWHAHSHDLNWSQNQFYIFEKRFRIVSERIEMHRFFFFLPLLVYRLYNAGVGGEKTSPHKTSPPGKFPKFPMASLRLVPVGCDALVLLKYQLFFNLWILRVRYFIHQLTLCIMGSLRLCQQMFSLEAHWYLKQLWCVLFSWEKEKTAANVSTVNEILLHKPNLFISRHCFAYSDLIDI